MPCDLEVDTERIRACAELLGLAAELLAMPRSGPVTADAGRRGSGGPAAFREAARWAAVRADQCVDCAAALSGHADGLAASLRAAAGRFDEAEALCASGW